MSETRRLRLTLTTTAGDLAVRRATITEALSAPTHASLEVHSPHVDPGFAGLVDEEVTLAFTRDGFTVRTIALRLAAVRFLGVREGVNAFELDLRSSFWFLKLTKNTRKFRDKSAREIVAAVLGGKVGSSFQLTREPWSLPYTVQYRESDYDFVSRLLEFDGIYYEATDEDTLAIHDASSSAESFNGGMPLELITAAGGLSHGDEALFGLSRITRVGSGRATVNDYNWKTPSKNLIQSAAGKRDELLEVYDYPTGYRAEEQGKTLARLRVEAFEARKRAVRGETSFVALRPNRLMTIAHMDGIDFSGEYCVTEVTHVYEDFDDATTAHNRFEAIPRETPFRPKRVTPRPEVGGYDTAMVRGPAGEEIHTDKYGRCKVQFHWDREAKGTDEDSRWIRVLQETSSSLTLARVGWEVAVTYEDSDPDRPVAIARMMNGQMVPTYGQPAHQNVMTIRTETYPGKDGFNEIRLDDTAGAQQIYMHAEHRHEIDVKHDKQEWVGNNEHYTVHSHVARHVKKTQAVSIGHDLVRNTGANDTVKVEGNRTETIGGKETVKVGETVALNVSGNEAETVGALRITIAGGIQPPKLPDPLGGLKGALPKPDPKALVGSVAQNPQGGLASAAASLKASIPTPASLKASLTGALKPPSLESLLQGRISRNALQVFKRIVGGAMISVAGAGISHTANKLLAEITGGLRLAIALDEAVSTTSTGKFTRLVGGMVIRKAGEDVASSAHDSSVTVGGNATVTVPDKIELRSDRIEVNAARHVRLQKGDLSIDMTPAKMVIKGDLTLKAKDKIHVQGKPDNLTR